MSRQAFSGLRNALLFTTSPNGTNIIRGGLMSPRAAQYRASSTVHQILMDNEDRLPSKEELQDHVSKVRDKVPLPKYTVILHIPDALKQICFDATVDMVTKGGFKAIVAPDNVRAHASNLSLELNKLAKRGDHNATIMLDAFRDFSNGKVATVLILDQLPKIDLTPEKMKSLGLIPVVSPVESSIAGAIQMDNELTLVEETRIAAAQHLPNAFFSFAALFACGKGRPEDIYCMRRADSHRLGTEGAQYENMGGFGLSAIQASSSLKTVVLEADQIMALYEGREKELEALKRSVFFVPNRLYNFENDGTKTFPVLSQDADGKWRCRYSDSLLVSMFCGLSSAQMLETAIAIENLNVMAECLLAEGRVLQYGFGTGDMGFIDARHLIARVDSQGKIADAKEGKDVKILDENQQPRRVMMMRTTLDGITPLGRAVGGKASGNGHSK